jgi:putative FmdB family regulatory protein
MPLYEYECKKCGCQIEVLQKFSDPPLARCERCNGKMRKLISHSSFHLKGTGWYVTDYASKGTGKEKSAKPVKDSTKKEAKAAVEKPAKGKTSE